MPEAKKFSESVKQLDARATAAAAARKAMCDTADAVLAGVIARHGAAQVVGVSDLVKLLHEIGPNRIT